MNGNHCQLSSNNENLMNEWQCQLTKLTGIALPRAAAKVVVSTGFRKYSESSLVYCAMDRASPFPDPAAITPNGIYIFLSTSYPF